jgi:uncharacterized protein YyaL (SSP411 family)
MFARPAATTLARGAYRSLIACVLLIGCTDASPPETTKGDTRPMTRSAPGSVPPGKNRLALEKSPYLLQHADNPVDWYPWGKEAFEKARREDKPIFLSIGYSTCHWCHVMEHESFEDSTVAALMNETFVNIKVDREERPEIDNIYMTVCQMMTGGGGWPLTIVMTPDAKPFFAATYIPRTEKYGRAGMIDMIPQISAFWKNHRHEADAASVKVTEQLRSHFDKSPGDGTLGSAAVLTAFEQLSGRFDAEHGGFSRAPKFPTPHNMLFLLRYWNRTGDKKALSMVERTLDEMARGGIYDHVGFGFHRYSTDERWFAPHFEKMLYDQALLAMAYTEGYLATGNESYKRITEEVIEYVLRDMTDDRGGFYSAEDADSEGVEGKFYLWTEAELNDLLGEEDAALVVEIYGVNKAGNFAEDVQAANILYMEKPLSEIAFEHRSSVEEFRARVEAVRKRLYFERVRRVRPHKDDKILTDWNGLMIAALAKAGRAFGNDKHLAAAKNAAMFIMDNMRTDEGRLLHRYRDGEAGIAAAVDDYAFFVWGLIELYQSTFDVSWLKTATELQADMVRDFWDSDDGGFFFTPAYGEQMIARSKEIYDGAVPSGNSVAHFNLLRLGRMTADPDAEKRAVDIGTIFFNEVSRSPSAFAFLMAGIEFLEGEPREVVIVGDADAKDTQSMRRAIDSRYLPNLVTIFKPVDSGDPEIVRYAEFTRPHTAVEGRATAYVCENYACQLPTTDTQEMLRLIDGDPK